MPGPGLLTKALVEVIEGEVFPRAWYGRARVELHEDPRTAGDGEKPRTSPRRPETRLGSPSVAVGGERRGRFADSRAAVPRIPSFPFSASPSSTTGSLYSPRTESAPGDSRRGDGRSGRERGSPPLPRRNPAAVCGLMRPPLLMVVVVVVSTAHRGTLMRFSLCRWLMLELLQVGKAQPCVLRRFTPASRRKCVAARGHGRQELRAGQYQLDDDEPLWLAVVRDITWGLRSFLGFLAEQPRQLKHLEWPGFRNTLRTATLTLILVAVFIVALSSVDAALCYILSWLLRKSAYALQLDGKQGGDDRTIRRWTLSVIGDEAIGLPAFISLQV
uniref:Uncharacterized protein n=1 Tax=Oryza meridionalis TaxID=40149 RepID=A0A0E0EUC7_9ORYZ